MHIYVLHFIANLSVIVAVITSYLVIFERRRFNLFVEAAFLGVKKPEYLNRNQEPWYKPERLWRMAILLLGLGGTCCMLYGGFKELFSWMPYSWRDEQGEWAAISMAGTFSFVGALVVYTLFSKIASIIEVKESLVEEVCFQYALRESIRDFLTASEGLLEYKFNFCYLIAIASDVLDKYDLILTSIARQRKLISDNELLPKIDHSDSFYGILRVLREQRGRELINSYQLEKNLQTNEGPRAPSLDFQDVFDAGSYHVKLVRLAIWAELNGKVDALKQFLISEARWCFR